MPPELHKEYGDIKQNIFVILFNNVKLKEKTRSFFISVIIHEMIHYFDYQNTKSLAEKFKLKLYKDPQESRENRVCGFFQMWSEMRAKYYQEKSYVLNNGLSGSLLFDNHVNKNYTKLKGEGDWYNMAHQWGQLLCWNECGESLKERQAIRDKCVNIYKDEHLTIFLPLNFEWNSFIKFANFYYENHEAFESIIEIYLDETYSDNYWWKLIKEATN